MKITTTNAPKIIAAMRTSGVLLSCRTYNSGGPGGQHNNRTENAVELIAEWNIDGRPFRAKASACMKSQHHSRAVALRILAGKLNAEIRRRRAAAQKGEAVIGFGGGGADRVRTYHEPDNRVTDTAGFQVAYAGTVGKGDLGPLIEGRGRRMAAEALASRPGGGP